MFIRSGGGGAEREEPKWEGAEPTRGRGGQSKGRRPPADLEQVDSFSLIISFFYFFGEISGRFLPTSRFV